MGKLLITGASGFLGWHLCHIARDHWQVYGTYHRHPVTMPPDISLICLNLEDSATLQQIINDLRPDAIVHTAALSRPNDCQTQPERSYAINVMASWSIAEICAKLDIPCVFTSTDLVFDGKNPPYSEKTPPCPLSIYGQHKALAEEGMLQRYPNAVICRMPLMFGEPSPTSGSFLQPFLQKLREGQVLKLFYDEYRMPVSATTAAQGLLLALEKAKGRLHLGGKERLSRYEFGCIMADVLDLPHHLIQKCSQKDVPMSAPRPADLSLNSDKAFNLGYNPPTVKAELMALRGKV